MSDQIARELEYLLQEIGAAPEDMLHLHPKVHRLMAKLTAAGRPVPSALRSLDQTMSDAESDARFDNLPI